METPKEITGLVDVSQGRNKKIENVIDLKKEIELSFKEETTKIIETILCGAISLGASDIHIEAEKEEVKLRMRLDGLLQDILFFEKPIYESLLSRIKLLSGIKLNISDRPQDGRFSVKTASSLIEIRASVLPAEEGEAIVLRVLNPKSVMGLDVLGLRKDLLELFKKEIKKPNGMIVVTGPTGSGKTTTLYAFLKEVCRPEIKIITIEDPVEYRLEGVSQTQVAPEKGYDFVSGLRAIVRQDPDVILVGEIRDIETANIGLQSSLTGHLVLTTLHTNDAAGTIFRLINLGANPADLGPAINLIIAQRLVRKICPSCAKFEAPSSQELKKIKIALKKPPKNIKIPKAGQCKKCNFTGYKGRIGIYEAFLVDDEMEKLILKKPSVSEIKELAIKRGMKTIYCDGLIKVLAGITTIEELDRVASEEEQ
ncbi:MAG: GspE/PulE family protein [bacterium]